MFRRSFDSMKSLLTMWSSQLLPLAKENKVNDVSKPTLGMFVRST